MRMVVPGKQTAKVRDAPDGSSRLGMERSPVLKCAESRVGRLIIYTIGRTGRILLFLLEGGSETVDTGSEVEDLSGRGWSLAASKSG